MRNITVHFLQKVLILDVLVNWSNQSRPNRHSECSNPLLTVGKLSLTIPLLRITVSLTGYKTHILGCDVCEEQYAHVKNLELL